MQRLNKYLEGSHHLTTSVTHTVVFKSIKVLIRYMPRKDVNHLLLITPVYKIFGDLLLGVIIGVFKCADSINEHIF